MYRKQVRRRRAVLVLLVVACLMLISISISEAEDGPLHSVQNGISSVLGPIQEGASRALKPARDLVNWFDETFDARGENDQLKRENAALSRQVLDLRAAAEDAGYAKEVDKLVAQPALDAYEPVQADVLLRSFSAWYGGMTIDVGTSSGVEPNDAVVSANGLVGRVESVSGGTARVILITDGRSPVTARVVGKGPQGLVQAVVGSPGELDMTLIQGDKDPSDGDKLVTAGFSEAQLTSRYPAGIPIGEVSETTPTERDGRLQVRVEPFADLSDLDGVTVLTGGGS